MVQTFKTSSLNTKYDDADVGGRKPTYIPPMRPYEMSDLTMDLIEFARYMLKPGGRLVFFLPTVTEDYSELDVPECDGMKMVGNSIQDFGKWARRVRMRTPSLEIGGVCAHGLTA